MKLEKMDDFEDLPLLPPELIEKWESIKEPFGGMFGNSVLIRVLREIIADPNREFRPIELEKLTSATAPSIKKALDTLTSLDLLKNEFRDSQRPFYRTNLDSERLTALTLLAYAVTDDRDGTDYMDDAIKDYYDYVLRNKYESGVINNITISNITINTAINLAEGQGESTGELETGSNYPETIDLSMETFAAEA